MSRMVEMNLNPDTRILRQFGFIALVGFGLLALLAWTESMIFAMGLGEHRDTIALALAAVGGVSLLFSLVAPKLNFPIYVGLTILSYPIGFVLSYVIMGTLFFLIIGPIGLVMRAVGKDPMKRAIDKNAPSYWSSVEKERPRESYFRQF